MVRRVSVSNFQRGSAWARGFAWSARGRRVVGFGIVLRLAALLTHPLTLPRRTADDRGATQDRSTTPRGASRWSESRFGGIQFRTFSVVLRWARGFAWSARGRRVVGFGIVLRLAALLTHPLTLPRRTADGRGATQDRSTTPRGASRWSETRFGGFQFRTFSVVLRGRVGSR